MEPVAEPVAPPFVDPFEALRAAAKSVDDLLPRKRATRKRDAMFPWLLALSVTLPVAVLASGLERAVAIGASTALVGGALVCRWLVHAERQASERVLRQSEARLRREAEDRVSSLRRQFEWSVDEVVELRRRLKVADLRERLMAERVTAVEASRDDAEREARDAKRALFELAAADVKELKDARDAAVAARVAADRRAQHAQNALAQSVRQLEAARQRVTDLTSLLASIVNPSPRPAIGDDRDDVTKDDPPAEITWALEHDDDSVAISVRTTLPGRAIRLRDPAGATVLLKRIDPMARSRTMPYTVQVTDPLLVAGLEIETDRYSVDVRAGDRWYSAVLADERRVSHVDKRLRVWAPTPVVRIVG